MKNVLVTIFSKVDSYSEIYKILLHDEERTKALIDELSSDLVFSEIQMRSNKIPIF